MDATTLLEHRAFVTSVARALLRDEHEVEDVVQETYVAALEADPPRAGKERSWLAGITRNLARNRQRARARRLRREAAVARPESTTGSTEKLRWQQRVVEQVLALAPPYRDVIVLRYFEELPPRAIAQRLDVPVNTVRTRTRRALAQMRGAFDRSYGRAAWTGALALFFLPKAAFAGKLVAAGLVALVAGTVWLGRETFREGSERVPRRNQSSTDVTSSAAPRTDPVQSEEPATPEPPRVFRGQLFDYREPTPPPLAGATVRLRYGGHLRTVARTDDEGRFQFDWPPDFPTRTYANGWLAPLLFVTRDGLWSDATYLHPTGLEGGVRQSVELIANPRLQLFVGEGRAPEAGARISLHRFENELGPAVSSAIADANGVASPEWPSTMDRSIVRVLRPNGDVVQWALNLSEVRLYDPYDIDLSESAIVTVRVRVLLSDGKTPAPGAHVYADAGWAPDGEGTIANRVPLRGVTDRNGDAVFRFPAIDARRGSLHPSPLVAWRETTGSTLFAFPVGPIGNENAARSGESLPTLRLAPVDLDRPVFAVPRALGKESWLCWKDDSGRRHWTELKTRFYLPRSDLRFVWWEDPELPREFEAVVVRTKRGFRWAEVTNGPLRFGDPIGTREIQLQGSRDTRVLLECLEAPFVIEGYVRAGRDLTLDIPNGSRKWVIRSAADGAVLARFDPTTKARVRLD
ncbi:MAG: RNA polymerase sigma factor [Planctomycetota bacterium]